jgi:hypothetical protein
MSTPAKAQASPSRRTEAGATPAAVLVASIGESVASDLVRPSRMLCA